MLHARIPCRCHSPLPVCMASHACLLHIPHCWSFSRFQTALRGHSRKGCRTFCIHSWAETKAAHRPQASAWLAFDNVVHGRINVNCTLQYGPITRWCVVSATAELGCCKPSVLANACSKCNMLISANVHTGTVSCSTGGVLPGVPKW